MIVQRHVLLRETEKDCSLAGGVDKETREEEAQTVLLTVVMMSSFSRLTRLDYTAFVSGDAFSSLSWCNRFEDKCSRKRDLL